MHNSVVRNYGMLVESPLAVSVDPTAEVADAGCRVSGLTVAAPVTVALSLLCNHGVVPSASATGKLRLLVTEECIQPSLEIVCVYRPGDGSRLFGELCF